MRMKIKVDGVVKVGLFAVFLFFPELVCTTKCG